MKTIYFDMDGTIADFYGVDSWLDYLLHENTYPYEVAQPLHNMELLNSLLKNVKSKGYKVGIISWCSKNGTKEYNTKVRQAKKEWLKKYIDVKLDSVHIVKYGTNKSKFNDNDILFDDEKLNRDKWGINAYSQDRIIEVLQAL